MRAATLLLVWTALRLPAFAADSITLLDWNIDRGMKLDAIAAAIARERPDVCLLQEVDLHARRTAKRDIARELAERLGLQYVFGPEFQELAQGSPDEPAVQGQAVLTSLPILASRVLRFERQSGFWKPRFLLPRAFQRRLGGRSALVVELAFAGRTLVIYNTHLESKSRDATRLAQLDEILADARRYPPETPILIGGDLNTFMPHSALLVRLRQAGFRSSAEESRQRTHRIGTLDWMFIRGPVRFEGGGVLRTARGSDHFPIVARLVFPAPAEPTAPASIGRSRPYPSR
jgi:endonuclease/exonuclease/phosphatase family metal-dependent hydrolase